MTQTQLQIYREPRPDGPCEGMIDLRKDVATRYWIGNVKIVRIFSVENFTALECIDGTTHYALTDDFERVKRSQGALMPNGR